MNELTRIYKDHNVRIIEKDGQPWFAAKDVAEILGYSETAAMTRRLDKDEKTTLRLPQIGLNNYTTNITVLNEYGLFAAILKSNKKEAIDFQRWVTHEVLPSIHKSGSYAIQPQQPRMLTTDAQCEAVMERMKEEVDRKLDDLAKLEGSQNRARFVSIVPQLTDYMCENLLHIIYRKFGIKPEKTK